MKEVNFINDNFMTYDIDLHMYKLEPDAVSDIIETYQEEISYNALQSLLIMVRDDFYSECLDYAIYRDQYLHYLSLLDNRAYIKEAMRMMFTDLIITRTTPGLSIIGKTKHPSLVTPRTNKYMQTMKLILIQGIHDTPKWQNQRFTKGVE